MYEEERRFSWTNLFIKIIIVVIFILFTIWLLSLSIKSGTRGLSDSLGVLTDNIFSQNVDKMKEVGKSYFTTERLPEKVGEVKTLTLAKMYDENLILELRDKNGNACSAKKSYVVIEKMENEYQMKVYLECGDESDYIKVIMGCYDYCKKDICEKKQEEVVPVSTNLEYEYGKKIGGTWTSYGSWSEWSNVSVSKTEYRDVETKTVKESYTYDKEITETKYVGEATCPNVSGYKLIEDNDNICSYVKTVTYTEDPLECANTYDGYKLVSQDGFTCNYSKSTKSTTNPEVCANTYNGYTLISQDGFTCNYSKSTSSVKDPLACADTYNGYTLVSQDGFTCNYSKSTKSTKDPVACADTYNGYTLVSQDGFTCNYSKSTRSTREPLACASTYNGYTLVSQDGFTCNYAKEIKDIIPLYDSSPDSSDDYDYSSSSSSTIHVPGGVDTGSSCSGCGDITVPTYRGYAYRISVNLCPSGYSLIGRNCVKTTVYTTTTTVGCPSGYSKSGASCIKSGTTTTTTTVGCPSGYSKSGNSCVKSGTATTTTTVGCPSGYSKSGDSCIKSGTKITTTTVGCPSGYSKSGDSCVKKRTSTMSTVVGCPSGYSKSGNACTKTVNMTKTKNAVCASGEKLSDGKCYKEVKTTKKVTEDRDVTYYRYRVREYKDGVTDYRWSTSNNDKSLLDAGYSLTGRTRSIGGK